MICDKVGGERQSEKEKKMNGCRAERYMTVVKCRKGEKKKDSKTLKVKRLSIHCSGRDIARVGARIQWM